MNAILNKLVPTYRLGSYFILLCCVEHTWRLPPGPEFETRIVVVALLVAYSLLLLFFGWLAVKYSPNAPG